MPWAWIVGAAAAFLCLALVVGVLLGGLATFGASTATPRPPTVAPVTSLPSTLAPQVQPQVEVVPLAEGASADSLYELLQPPLSDTVEPTVSQYTAVISNIDEVNIGPGWCAKDTATLEENWSKASFAIDVDGRAVDLATLRLGDLPDRACRQYFGLARGWPLGDHRVVITRTFAERVNDGWCDYGAGDYVAEITVKVLTPEAIAAATQQAPPPLGSGHRVIEDFSTDRGIYTYQGACWVKQHVSGGTLHQSVSVTDYEVWAGLPGTYTNFEMTVEATFDRVDGAPAKYGVQFRKADSYNYYGFYVSDNRQFLFGKNVGNTWSDIVAWTSATACHGNSGQTDTLGVVAVGSRFEFYCNGALLGQAEDSTFSQGAIALLTGTFDATYAEVTFDNVSLTGR